MDIDLFTSDTNLTLIVGHNGPHSPEYTKFIEKKLNDFMDLCDEKFGDDWMDKIQSNEQIQIYINKKVKEIIKELKQEVRDKGNYITSIGEIFILE